MQKRHFYFLAVLVCGRLGIGVWAMAPRTPLVTKANFDRIEAGMSPGQVSRLLNASGEMGRCSEMICPWNWVGDGNRVSVHFNQRTNEAIKAFFDGADGARFARNPL